MCSTGGKLSALLVCFVAGTSSADAIQNGVNFLLRNQGVTGGFGEALGEEPNVTTYETLLTLRATGAGTTAAAQGAELYLATSLAPIDSEIQLRRELALAPTAFALPSFSLLTEGPGFEQQDALQMALSLKTLRQPGQLPTAEQQNLAVQLAQLARADGCYAFVENDPSVELTADVASAFRSYSFNPNANFAYLAALNCLRTLQQANGSWGTITSTASAVLALLEASGNNATAISTGRSYLIATQAADGSWPGGVRAAALATRALVAGAPDWRITTDDLGRPALVLSNPEPLQGVTFTASFDVENRSSSPAPTVNVRFTATRLTGGPDVVLAEIFIPAMSPGQVQNVRAVLPTAQLGGRYNVRAVVNPDGVVAELDSTNNSASAPLNVRQENDLAVSASNIRFVTIAPNQVQINVIINNYGATLPINVAVNIYKGNPSSGGTLIGSGAVNAGLAANQTATISVNWNTTTINGPTPVYVLIDPTNQLVEADKTNNIAFRFFYPGNQAATDLAVNAREWTVNPPHPSPRQPFTVSVPVHNLSASDANRVQVAIYNFSSGEVLSQLELSQVPATGVTVAQFTVSLPFVTGVKVIVDPQQLIQDPNRANNTDVLGSFMSSTSDVELTLFDLSTSNVPAAGGQFTVKASVLNTGSQTANTSIRLIDETDGTQLSLVPLVLPSQNRATVSMGPITRLNRPMSLKACVDPFNLIQELNKNDNCLEVVISDTSADVFIAAHDIQVSPVGVDVGESVHLSATVRSNPPVTTSGVVEWWHGRPSNPEGVLIGTTPVQISSGVGTAAFDWVRKDGVPEIHARVVSAGVLDPTPRNNQNGRHLFLDSIVDIGVPRAAGEEVRFGRLTGRPAPEMILGYAYADLGPFGATHSWVAVLQRGPDGSYSPLWQREVLTTIIDIVLADLDGDAIPEVVVWSVDGTGTTPRVRITAYEPDGSTKWEQNFSASNVCLGSVGQTSKSLGLGDVNGDGIADLVYVDDNLRVFSGRDGAEILRVALTTRGNCVDAPPVVLDVDGSGAHEILGITGDREAFLMNADGTIRWRKPAPNASNFAVIDLDLSGTPKIVFPVHRNSPIALDALTGNQLQVGSPFESHDAPFGLGSVRQDGLPYATLADNSFDAHTAAFGPDLQLVWEQFVTGFGAPDDIAAATTTLADLWGLGRPQLILHNAANPLLIEDGRDGRILLRPVTNTVGSMQFSRMHPLTAVDFRGDGRSGLAIPTQTDGTPQSPANQGVDYAPAQVLIFSSTHWKKMPTVWNARQIVRGRVDENLKVSTDYRWWRTNNTWNQQFDQQPATLLPDLVVRRSDITATPSPGIAGNSTSISAQISNVGGLPASNVKVSFYDGDPNAGGALIGDSMVAGPLAPRTGRALASVSWTAYPEGQHTLFVVANSDNAIQESGRDNNTASTTYFVQPGTQLCDLAIDPLSLVASPAAPNAGDRLALSATVKNIGVIPCSASLLTVYDGAPAEGAPLVGSVAIPSLAVQQSIFLTVSTIAAPGTHLFRFIADEAALVLDGDRSNNIAMLQLFVPASTLSDLLVASLSAAPNPAFPGEPVVLSASVRNQGAGSRATDYVVTLNSLTGPTVAGGALPPLRAGESTALSIPINAPTASAQLFLTVNPSGTVPEFDRSNNTSSVALVVADPGLVASGTASPSSAGVDTTVTFSLRFQNTGVAAKEIFLDATVVAPNGATQATVTTAARYVLPGLATTPITLSWNTGRSTPGSYRLRAVARASGRTLAIADVPFSVISELSASTAIATDRGTYAPGGTVLIDQRTTNASRNQTLQGASVIISVLDSSARVLFRTTRQLPNIPAQGFLDTTDLFAISPSLPPGNYLAASKLNDRLGNLLAEAQVTWQLVYQATQTVTGKATVPSPFAVGQVLPVTVQLRNIGALDLTNGQLLATVLKATGLVAEAGSSISINLPAGQTQNFTVNVSTTGVVEGQKLVVVQLDGRVLDRVMAQGTHTVEPPLITVRGVNDRQLTNQNVTPVITITSPTTFASTITLDNQPFTSGTTVSAEGDHVLFVRAVDSFNNASQLTIHFTIDKTPPVLTLSGVQNGDILNHSVTLTFFATDLHPGTTSSTLDGNPIVSGSVVTAEGDHVWVVTSTDAAGNAATQTRSFSLDFTPPVITVTGVSDGQFSNRPLTPSITATDLHLATVTITLDGQPFTSGTPVTAEGSHTLNVVATDRADNQSTKRVVFTLDFTPPVITTGGVTSGALLNRPVTLTFSATDINLDTVVGTVDGTPITSGTTVGAEGPHVFHVRATDKAGNVSDVDIAFELDFTPPVITVRGIAANQFRNTPVTIFFTATDRNLAFFNATMDGAAFTSGSTVSTEGPHRLRVHAEDRAGNVSDLDVPFTLDFTPPVVTVTGVNEGEISDFFVISFTATDLNLDTVVARLDGKPFTSGTRVDSIGAHTLVVTAADKAGNVTTVTRHFTIVDMRPPFHFAACAFENLNMDGRADVTALDGGVASVAAHHRFSMGEGSLVHGDVVSGGNASVGESSRVTGTVYFGGALKLDEEARVGGASHVSPPPQPCECGFDVGLRLAIARVHNDNARLEADPSIRRHLIDGGLEVKESTVTLPGGRYYLQFLSLRDRAQLRVQPGQSVQLFVVGGVSVLDKSTLDPLAPAAGSLLVVSGADSSRPRGEDDDEREDCDGRCGGRSAQRSRPHVPPRVELRDNVNAALQLYAPLADIALGDKGKLVGAIVGRNIRLEEHQTLLLAPGPQPVPPPLTCP